MTKSQERKLKELKRDDWMNPLKSGRDIFIQFDVEETDWKYLVVKVKTGPEDHEELHDVARYYLIDTWLIFISPRGKAYAPVHARHLEGRKNSILGNIRLTNIGD